MTVLDEDGPKKRSHLSKKKQKKWRQWHEREEPVSITGESEEAGIHITIDSKQLQADFHLEYPGGVWHQYPKENKFKLIDNITYVFTAHLPFLLKGNVRLEYNTGYPHSYSWAIQCFTRALSSYWYIYKGRHGTGIFPMLKTLLNSRSFFAPVVDQPPRFPESIDERIILPFTFGKDSFLSYYLCKDLGLTPYLVYFNEPTEEYSRQHKLDLIAAFTEETGEKVQFMDNPLGALREYGEGWFGWELALTSWTLLSLPFAYLSKAGYILYSSEKSVNEFFYDDEGFKVFPDFEQSGDATEELSLLSQSLSEGEVYVTTFLQGLNDLGIIGILRERYGLQSYKYLMSCWAETKAAEHKRWCAECSKCARLYIYMLALGIDPIKDAGFQDDMLQLEKKGLYNVFDTKASGTGWDAFGLNLQEQSLAFLIAIERGAKGPLLDLFKKSPNYTLAIDHFEELVDEYIGLHHETISPPQWKKKLDKIYKDTLKNLRYEVLDQHDVYVDSLERTVS